MEELYLAYLTLLKDLTGCLGQLAELAKQKSAAVRRDDLLALDGVLKQEQALSLSLRGHEQKRLKLLKQLNLEQVPLSQLYEHYPAGLKARAKQTAEELRSSYNIYHASAEVARNTLECNLHELDKIVTSMGGPQPEAGGYTPPQAEPPANMKTDFRA